MAFCPNCGSAVNDGAKFCGSCGGALPIASPQAAKPAPQPVQPQPQPVQQQPVSQPVYQQPVQIQQVQQQPVSQPVYQQPVVIQSQPQPAVIVQPAAQPVKASPKEKTNGFCSAGFVLSLLGLFLFGITSLFGLLFSIIGLISAGKKKQKGKGKAIAGIIMALLMVILAAAAVIVLKTKNPISDFIGSAIGVDLNYKAPEYDDFTTNEGWVLVEDETYIEFDSKDKTVKYCMNFREKEDFYVSGHYEMYTGKKARKYLTETLGDSGITEEELDEIIDEYDNFFEDNLVAITCEYEKFVFDGKVRKDFEPRTNHLFGFYTLIHQDENVFDNMMIMNIETDEIYTLIKESQYRDYVVDIQEPSGDLTDEYDEYDDYDDYDEYNEYDDDSRDDELTDNTTSDDEDIVGDNITGTVTITQGNWEVWREADGGLNDSIRSRHQRINIDTETIINLTAFDFTIDPEMLADTAGSTRQNMESEGVEIIDYGETTMAGYRAYTITGQYQDGMYLTVWLFTDSNDYLHYISVEYYDYDYASYEMVRDTYTMY